MQKSFKKVLILTFFFVFLLGITRMSYSQEKDGKAYFDVSAQTSYIISAEGETSVAQKIAIVNKEDFVYAPSYSITIALKTIKDVSVSGANGSLPYTIKEHDGSKTIDITFPERVVGKGNKNEFSFLYKTQDLARKSGTFWRFYIPAISNSSSFTSYSAIVKVPKIFGPPILVKPLVSYETLDNSFVFGKDALLQNGVIMFFGSSPVYEFKLTYNLENKNLFPIETEIAIPPNASYQEVLLKSVTPKPISSYKDKDGNMLLRYELLPKTSYKVKATVLIDVTSVPKSEELTLPERKLYLKPQKYWEVKDAEVVKIAQELKTPQTIYDYVVRTLSYDNSKVADKNTRLGAKEVLKKPYFAVCLEFTDLFIALSRAAGIPARAVEGFAYTDDDKSRPLSLFKDVLHAWPEYYDESRKAWVYVDPTWGNTTGGTDFFNQLDFDHVAFAINGVSSTYPVPAGGYKSDNETRDIEMSYVDKTAFVKENDTEVTTSFPPFFQGGVVKGIITLVNNGNHEIKEVKALVALDGKKIQEISFSQTPPLGTDSVAVSVPVSKNKDIISSLTNLTHKITIYDAKNSRVLATSTVSFIPFSEYLVLGGAFILAIVIVSIIAFKTRSIPVQKP